MFDADVNLVVTLARGLADELGWGNLAAWSVAGLVVLGWLRRPALACGRLAWRAACWPLPRKAPPTPRQEALRAVLEELQAPYARLNPDGSLLSGRVLVERDAAGFVSRVYCGGESVRWDAWPGLDDAAKSTVRDAVAAAVDRVEERDAQERCERTLQMLERRLAPPHPTPAAKRKAV